jgi:hypothetical protein
MGNPEKHSLQVIYKNLSANLGLLIVNGIPTIWKLQFFTIYFILHDSCEDVLILHEASQAPVSTSGPMLIEQTGSFKYEIK